MTGLSRNRNYRLLWTGQALSLFGFNAATIAFPLLTLAVTGSAAASGAVLGAVAAAELVAGLPAGALVDRWNRRAIMLACEAVQCVVAASLVVAAVLHAVTLAHLFAVAVAVGLCGALFEPAEDASLPSLVPADQLGTAVALNSARGSIGQLAGAGAGGFLYAAGRFLPFLVDAVTHAAAFVALAFVRIPPRPAVRTPRRHLAREMAEGVAWVWRQRDIRVTTGCAIVLNLFFSGFYVVVLVLARARGVPAGQIGLMAAMLGVGGLVGALAVPVLSRVLSPYASILGVFWALTALTPLVVLVHSGYLLGALFFAMALLPPSANTTIMTRQLLSTPDGLRGRLTGVLGLAMGVAATTGPVLGGLLIELLGGPRAVLTCSAGITLVTLVATASPTLRRIPRPSIVDSETKGAEMDDDARYEVLRNDEDQYSLWLLGQQVPAGWHRVGKEGTKDECSAYVDEVWTDMRPRSLRERMDAQS
jgi:uncharacterized protein YbdZ (MbtH family)/predicted MFS family arabinose efflux permease